MNDKTLSTVNKDEEGFIYDENRNDYHTAYCSDMD